jgi:hypothetical protein
MDFVVGGPGALQFCDAQNPKFLPVVSRTSPVAMTLDPSPPPTEGGASEITLTLKTESGKPIGPDELIPTSTRKVILLAIDPSLEDFQAMTPEAGTRPGEWQFPFSPRRSGTYRIFADFTPAATGLEMYASADLNVAPGAAQRAIAPAVWKTSWIVEQEGYRLTLKSASNPIHVRDSVELRFAVESSRGGQVSPEPLDGSLATLVAFDEARTGFVNLHADAPMAEGSMPMGNFAPTFMVTFSDPGRYVVWSRVNVGGREITAPFRIEVLP